ncbi:non-ribosomal peptide synthetase [Streptomyces pinistramenti]|uniref:non-ribosomal peptide synthetase n=1 Tax=Streptomyces pinistramenti TaxID=2884812 RepID=UPI001D080FE2|nr:non-ribosomal peptide synthetase [Streptomyces pinistramenti]MCB5906964.1 amino acid adenylation domain-containing protein [Streptomyces pinistramenti]
MTDLTALLTESADAAGEDGEGRIAPTSFAQRRLWFLDQLDPGNSAYNLVAALRLRGPLDLPALYRSLNRIVARHEALRTVFRADAAGEPCQHVAPRIDLGLPVTDLTHRPAADRAEQARAFIESETERAFDLAHGPLIRTHVVRLDDQDHVLAVICHHTVCDGWSMDRLFAELTELYAALTAGRAPELDPLPLQFGDHAARQHRELADPRTQDALAHWRTRLHGAPALLELPTSAPRPAVQGFDGASYTTTLDGETWQAVRDAARAHKATPFMLLLSAFALQLSRLSGADDLVIGSPSAGRARPELAPLIGMFVNTMPLRIDLSGDPSFDELLRRVRRGALDAFPRQDVPLERIVTELGLERARSHDPLFQAMFALQQPLTPPGLAGLSTDLFPVSPRTTFTDLWLEIRPHQDGADCSFRYRTELFDEAAVARLARQYRQVLHTALDAPGTPCSGFSLTDEEETERLLYGWSRTAPAHPWDGPVHEAVARQTRLTPDATAVVFDGRQLSYAELDTRAGALAAHLAGHGVTPDTPVAVCLPRGSDLVTAVLGVMSAGGAYLPLSPDDPTGRLVDMLRAAGAAHILTTEALAPALAAAGVPVTAVDTFPWDEAPHPGPPPAAARIAPGHLAYVIHTSGSTGAPKAVGVPHQGLANRVRTLQDIHGLDASDRVLHKTPATFDVSVEELLWPLTAGATLVVAVPGGHRDPTYLVELIERERVTTVHFVPPLLAAFLEEPGLDRCASLRRVLCSGQELPPASRDRCLERLPVRLFNAYGPTEASIEVTEGECAAGDADGGTGDPRVSIGRPVAGAEVYVLDGELRPVPVGVPGELYLGGTGLARGYLGQPALTADRFVPHPYSRVPGARLYRTGDLVRWRSDAGLDFLGRNDHQVKIRGVRIEPGEIENVIRTHPGVHEATVIAARPDGAASPELHAYLVRNETAATAGHADDDAFAGALRGHLRDRLPGFMVPARFLVLPRLPLNASGKVDRAALPAPGPSAAPAPGHEPAEPADEVEATLVRIWSQVLGRPHTEVTEDFFAIGGDSLKSIQLVHRAREAGLSLRVGDIFHHPTVQDLAAHLKRAAQTTAPAPAEAP